jgi:tungstate transport system substrate-binding protein
MTDTGFWQGLSERFTKETGLAIELVATGPKFVIAPVFQQGQADLITMHASDTIINLVADGYGADPQPWARNDLLLVGPADDPAKIAGATDAVAALAKIIESKSTLLVHQSLGSNEVLHDLLNAGQLELDDEHTVVMATDRQRQLLGRAAQEHAYTLVGRIPFLNGKIANEGLKIMVQGDPRLRRPYVVVVSRFNPTGSSRDVAARKLATFLRSKATQEWRRARRPAHFLPGDRRARASAQCGEIAV